MRLTEEQAAIRDTARDFAAREITPYAAEWDRKAHTPKATLHKMGDLGFMGFCTPPDWGGAGADFVSYVSAVEELAGGDCGLTNIMCGHNSPFSASIVDYGTQEQKERYLRPAAAGKKIGCFLITEPHAGSDASALRVRARRVGDKYVLSGTKQFITAGRTADFALIVAVTDPAAGKKGISCFLAETNLPGYTVAKSESKLGHRTCDTCQIFLDDLELPAESMLGAPGDGYKIALAYLSNGRIGVAAQAVGVAQAAFNAAVDYAQQRTTFGKAIIDHQAITFRLADMATQIEAARQLYLHAAYLKDAGLANIQEASMAKLFASEMAEKVCSAALQIHGGNGYLVDYPVEKFYRDVRVLQIYEGTSEIQRLIIGRQIKARSQTSSAHKSAAE